MGAIRAPVKVIAVEGMNGTFEAKFLLDTGATDCLVPAAELDRIGVRRVGKTVYELADGSVHEYAFGLVRLELMGELTAGRVIFGPDGTEPLLGVTALESVGLTIDPVSRTLKKVPAIPLKPSPATGW